MRGIRAIASTLAAIAAVFSLAACGLLDTGTSQLFEYAARADLICLSSYHRGLDGEAAAEERGEQRRWSGPKIEAHIRYAWADALAGQYRRIQDLGEPPENQALFRRWTRTSLERSRIYRSLGEAWSAGDTKRKDWLSGTLDLAKMEADHLAEPLPFRICGTPADPGKPDQPSRQELLADPPVRYTAEFPLANRGELNRGLGVYWYHQVAGRVVDLILGETTMLAEVRLKRRYARRAIGTTLQLFRSRKQPNVTWIAIIPTAAANAPSPAAKATSVRPI